MPYGGKTKRNPCEIRERRTRDGAKTRTTKWPLVCTHLAIICIVTVNAADDNIIQLLFVAADGARTLRMARAAAGARRADDDVSN